MPKSTVEFLDTLPRRSGGRPSAWPERVALLRTKPGAWVNATAVWGVRSRPSAETLKALGVELATRTMEGVVNYFVRIPA